MSFIYAEKIKYHFEDEQLDLLSIYSDTKVKLTGAVKSNWSTKQQKYVEAYGIIKSVIVSPNCCVSFAGNNIMYANDLFSFLMERGTFTLDDVVSKAYEIHHNAGKDDIEFLVCFGDGKEGTEIISIKNDTVNRDCPFAWIGSTDTFYEMQRLRTTSQQNYNSSEHFYREAANSSVDDSVGGFVICTTYSSIRECFIYNEHNTMTYEKIQVVESETMLRFSGDLEDGPFQMHVLETTEEVRVRFELIEREILYSSKYRLDPLDSDNQITKYLWLPIVIDLTNGKIL